MNEIKKILLTGANLQNKGAEAMILQILQETRRRYPECEVYVLDRVRKNPVINENFKLHFENFALKDFYAASGGLRRFFSILLGVKKRRRKEIDVFLDEMDFCFDLSGYAFYSGSKGQFLGPLKYLMQIQIMKKHDIPMILMPQSFGPFHFPFYISFYIKFMARKAFLYPKAVYAREELSYKALKEYCGSSNLHKSYDMVLLGNEVAPQMVCTEKYIGNFLPKVQRGSVAVIPNREFVTRFSEEVALERYRLIIDEVLAKGKKVYIIRHAHEDMELCSELKNKLFIEQENVVFLNRDFDCMEYSKLVESFDYIVTSRYHSIVHALKKSIPSVALGWADKYTELLEIFGQRDYVVNSAEYSDSKMEQAIKKMNACYQEEALRIKGKMEEIRKHNFYDEVFRYVEDSRKKGV